jgi:hypothetical protein
MNIFRSPLILLIYFLTTLNCTPNNKNISINLSTEKSIDIDFHLNEINFSEFQYRDINYTKILLPGFNKSKDIGNPNLPVLNKLIEIPENGKFEINIYDKEYKLYDLDDIGYNDMIFPSQRSISKGENSENVAFSFNQKTYNDDSFYSQDLVKIEILGKMRGKTIARVQISPISYNPVKNDLIVCEKFTFRIDFDSKINSQNSSLYSKDFNNNFKSLINFDNNDSKADFSDSPIKMIIISHPQFEDTIQEYLSWKTRKGYEIIIGYVGESEVGNSAESIKNFIRNHYENATPSNRAPSYLLIIGDHEQVPSFDMGNHVSDMYFCEFDGNGDYFPEMFFGRFSAENINQLTPQIDKTLQYEQYTMPDPSYLSDALMVAGVDASMAPTYGNGQINYGNDYYFNTDHGINSHTYLYPESGTTSAELEIIQRVSQGVGFGNYTAHCGPSGWGDPSFVVNDIQNLENEDKYGLLIGNCCQSSVFNGTTCFGEALLRADKKGAVSYIGATNNTYWNEDYWWAVGTGAIDANPIYDNTGLGIYDCSFHENNEQENMWAINPSQLFFSGNMAVSEANGSDQYYWEIYHLMGDPTILTYYGIPSDLSIDHPDAIPIGMNILSISSESHTYVAVNQNGILLDAGYTNNNGEISLSIDQLDGMEPLEIVASKQNKKVYISNINLFSPNNPYVVYSNLLIDDGIIGNNQVELNESFLVDVELQNFGLTSADNLTIEVSSDNPQVEITSNIFTVDFIGADTLIYIPNAASIEITGNFLDQEQINLVFSISDNQADSTVLWISNGNITINAPNLEINNFNLIDNFDDEISVIEFGDTATANLTITNIGNDISGIFDVNIYSEYDFIEILGQQFTFNPLDINENILISFPVSLDFDAPMGENYQIFVEVSQDSLIYDSYSINLSTQACQGNSFQLQLYDDYGDGWNNNYLLINDIEYTMPSGFTSYYATCIDIETQGCVNFEWIEGQYPEETSWIILNTSGSTYAQGDWEYFEDINLPNPIGDCSFGCTDPSALNYESSIDVDDGTCEFLNLDYINKSIKIYPNPINDKVKIDFNNLVVNNIIITDVNGREIFEKNAINLSTLEIDMQKLNSGVYFAKIIINEELFIIKRLLKN